MKKLDKSKLIESIGKEWIYLTVAEAVNTCNYILHTCRAKATAIQNAAAAPDENV